MKMCFGEDWKNTTKKKKKHKPTELQKPQNQNPNKTKQKKLPVKKNRQPLQRNPIWRMGKHSTMDTALTTEHERRAPGIEQRLW